jgi:hypothetical protein
MCMAERGNKKILFAVESNCCSLFVAQSGSFERRVHVAEKRLTARQWRKEMSLSGVAAAAAKRRERGGPA